MQAIRRELSDWRLWQVRAIVMGFAVLAGFTVVLFTWLTEQALQAFHGLQHLAWWSPLLWTPLGTATVVWLTRRYAAGAAGSGIPQVMAALTPGLPPAASGWFVSLRLTLAKMLLTASGLLCGLSLGREGPSVQIAAGVMHSARRFLKPGGPVSEQGLLIAGGAAGIAAAFNTPLGGIMFAIEELSRKPEQRSNGLIMAAIVLSGLMAVSVYGNATYFGVIRPGAVDLGLLGPALCVAVVAGLAGGLFSRLMAASLGMASTDLFTRWRRAYPVRFAAGCGLAVALMGLASDGATFGSGYQHTRGLLEGPQEANPLYVLLKFMATWVTSWSGVPGGIFAPSLAIGAGIGNDLAQWLNPAQASTLIALGMAGFLAAATQAPLTAFIIVMEMVDGHGLVLSLMASALVASGVSRLISLPLYASLAHLQWLRLPEGLRGRSEPGH